MATQLEPTEEELRERVIERVARVVAERRLETPFFAGQGALFALPVLGAFMPAKDVEALSRVLDSEETLDMLIARIETMAQERDARRAGG